MKMKRTVRLFAPALGLLAFVVLETGCGSSGTLDPPDPAGRNQQQVQQPSRTFGGPPLSGIFDAAASLLQEGPGQGRIAQITCTDGTNLGGGNIRINNETAIAGDPSNKNHLVAGSNDYELFFMGAAIIQRLIAGYYATFDGGTTWLNGHVPIGEFNFSGDPSVAFNKKLGLVHYGVAAFHGGQRSGFSDSNIQVNTSTDGGGTFGGPVVIARGTGSNLVSVANDKPYITVDNHSSSPFYGRLYVTWTRFVLSPHFNQAPIFLSFSDDGGRQTLASSTDGVSFTAVRVDSGLSNPNDSRWFTSGGTTNGKATFIRDYDGLVFDTDGAAHPIWTDMRSNVSAAIRIPPGRGHKTQNAVTAAQ